MSKFFRIIRDTRGASAIEYALVASLISIAAISAFEGLGERVDSQFSAINTAFSENI